MKETALYDLIETSDLDMFGEYWNAETIADERLFNAGYVQVRKWYTSEGDSFGPLCRSCVWSKDGVYYDIYSA